MRPAARAAAAARTGPRPEGVSGACWSSGEGRLLLAAPRVLLEHPVQRVLEGGRLRGVRGTGRRPRRGHPAAPRGAHRAPSPKSMTPPLVIAVSPHFYVVTNLDKKVKVRTYRGSYRLMTAHEVAHLYAQRCEQAYDDFEHWFGGPIVMPKPMAVYIVERVPDQQPRQRALLRRPRDRDELRVQLHRPHRGGLLGQRLRRSAPTMRQRRQRDARVRPSHGRAHPLLLLDRHERLRGPLPALGVDRRGALPGEAARDPRGVRLLLRRRDAGRRGPAQALAEARARHGQAGDAAHRDLLRAQLAQRLLLPRPPAGLVDHGPDAPRGPRPLARPPGRAARTPPRRAPRSRRCSASRPTSSTSAGSERVLGQAQDDGGGPQRRRRSGGARDGASARASSRTWSPRSSPAASAVSTS